MSDTHELTVSQLRRDLPTVLHRVLLLNESFVVMKHGQPFAVLSPITDQEDRERIHRKLIDGMDELAHADDVLVPAGPHAEVGPK